MQRISVNLNLMIKKTCKQILLGQMEQLVPWMALTQRSAPYYLKGKRGGPLFSLETIFRGHFIRLWFNLFDLDMEQAIFGTSRFREFAGALSAASYLD